MNDIDALDEIYGGPTPPPHPPSSVPVSTASVRASADEVSATPASLTQEAPVSTRPTPDAAEPTSAGDTIPQPQSEPLNPEPTTDLEAAETETPPIQPDLDSTADSANPELLQSTTFQLAFRDFACDPIVGIKYRIRTSDGMVIGAGATDGSGLSIPFEGLEPAQTVEISVFREFSEDYKTIGDAVLAPGNHLLTCISPKIKFDAETQLYKGDAGKADEELPPVPKTLEELAKENSGASNHAATPSFPASIAVGPVPSTSETSPAGQYSVVKGDTLGAIAKRSGISLADLKRLNPQITNPAALTIDQVVNVPTAGHVIPSSAAPAKPQLASARPSAAVGTASKEVTYGRDTKGRPVATIKSTVSDWLDRNIMPMMNFWTHGDFSVGNKNSPTSGHPIVNPPTKASSPVASASKAPVVGESKAKVAAPVIAPDADAITHISALVEFEEKQVQIQYPKGSLDVLNAYARKQTNSWGAKIPTTFKGQCLQYVKVALAKTGYVNGVSGTADAKDSGKDWLAAGFQDVTAQIPIVDIFTKGGEKISQCDLVYTLPGDVIVYKEFGQTTKAGHVEIRTYHGFGSDAFWAARGGFSDQSKYKVIGVYRKFSDTLASMRLQAFLRILREHETKGFSDPYHAMFDPSGKTKPLFTDDSKHPCQDNTNPAGAYQIKYKTFKDVIRAMNWAKIVPLAEPIVAFDKNMQDRVAIYLLQSRYAGASKDFPRRTALGYILQGDVEKAVGDCRLYNEWACLPGDAKQAQMTTSELVSIFRRYIS